MTRRSSTSWGLDLSTNPRKCAAVAIRWDLGRPRVVNVKTRLTPEEIVDEIAATDDHFAVDVPFGWPDTFVQFIATHQHGQQQPPGDRDAWRKETLARRLTDERLRQHRALPLPASFDRLGKTAVMWSAIEFDLAARGVRFDRAGSVGRVCETYPTAVLAAWHLDKKKPPLDLIERAFPFLDLEDHRSSLAGDDARDALICSLTARAHALGLTVAPNANELEQANREGWIHVMEEDPRQLITDTSWIKLRFSPPDQRSLDEDGPKRTFDYYREDGSPPSCLDELGLILGTSLHGAAETILNYSHPAAVPRHLSREAWDIATHSGR
ncbi:DUF429 domain-containing protein [Janibacter hoylei]|uniref:DUF429 domain-containing protein n=1 Tax=Janibacter hoylei TaxID=364298 RepID=UPI0021A8405D|nr:DUF429 domain-containing protein [Janibacter hoylei]MCT1617665.1 DUF429 domain-containing protein [Janibacter hoylei]MCT2291812.1 DUF429 domain-containing protein [Janibacter hoylei]